MGYLAAADMAAHADIKVAVEWHLRSNLSPPVSLVFLPVALASIELCRDGCGEDEMELPNGRVLTASNIVSQLHLEAFVDAYNNEEE